jgi:hypothetical protein
MPLFRVWLESSTGPLAPVVPSGVISFTVHAALIGAVVAVQARPAAAPRAGEPEERVTFLLPFDKIPRERYQPIGLDWKAVGVDVGLAIGDIDPEREDGAAEAERTSQRGKRGRMRHDAHVLEPSFRENDFNDNVFTVLEVDSGVARFPDSAAPSYPPDLLQMGVEGVVRTRYVVDSTGVADTTSLTILFSTHPGFTAAVRAALPQMRFRPASLAGRHVRQLVEQEFSFKITRPTPASRRGGTMDSGHHDLHPTDAAGDESGGPRGYPTHHVLGVIDTHEQAERAVEALTRGGFLESEIHVATGPIAADRVHATTGRAGLANLAIRIAERLGVADDEMETKASYEAALREGHFLLLVAAATDARKERAAQLLREHGAHSVNYMGRFTREEIFPPGAP